MTRGRWIGIDGWPCDHPPGLINAIAALPGASAIGAGDLAAFARLIEAVAEGGKNEELPSARETTVAASDQELVTLHRLATKLADHIESMHQPAISTIAAEGASLHTLVLNLRQTVECARQAYGATAAPEKLSGRPPKVAAAEVTKIAAVVFEKITGRKTTFTTNPATSNVSGVWPDFLGKVFAALYIKASVASQVKADKSEN